MTPTPEVSATADDTSSGRLQSALNELAGLLLDTTSFHDVIEQLAVSAPRTVPGTTTAGITVANGGRVITVAAADGLALLLDERQYDMDEGPCLQAMRTAQIVDVPDMAVETRWGTYPAQVRAHGIESSHSLPLIVRDQTLGVLNLYSDHRHAFDSPASRQAAAQLTTLITVAMTGTLRNYGDITLTDQLQQALASRSPIDQAMGIIMATQRCTPDQAFAVLRTASQTRNIRLHQLALDLIERTVTTVPDKT